MGLRAVIAFVAVCLCMVSAPAVAQPVPFASRFPLVPAPDGHYLLDQLDCPFLYIADSPWLLAYTLTTAEADEYLSVRQAQGFTVLQLQILTDNYLLRNQAGQLPLGQLGDRGVPDLSDPNETFFNHLDTLINLAARHNLAVMLAPAWFGTGTNGWRRGLAQTGVYKARTFGQFLGTRYAHDSFPNVIGWIYGGQANPGAEIREIQALAEGIQSVEKNYPRLHTAEWQAPFSTRDQTPAVAWLNLNAIHTTEPNRTDAVLAQYQIYAAALRDYQRQPPQPAILIGSDDEDPSPDAFVRGVSPAVIRRQMWSALLSGSAGVAYGSVNGSIRRTDWREMQQLPVARQLRVVSEVLDALPWTQLIPDGLPDPRKPEAHRLIVSGNGTFYPYPGLTDTTPVSTTALMVSPSPGADYIVAAATPERSVVVVYVPPTGTMPRSFEIDLKQKQYHPLQAHWINPVTGESLTIKNIKASRQLLTTPGDNGTGQNDWLLVVRPR